MKQVELEQVSEVRSLAVLNTTFNVYGTLENPLFLAVDIAEMIEYNKDKTHQMLELVDDDEKLTDTIHRGGQKREVWFVTENGMYELLMQSRKPLAKKFKAEIKKLLRNLRLKDFQKKIGMSTENNTLSIENARLIFRNFAGEEMKFNRKGDRNFCVLIEKEWLDQLSEDGWNIKTLTPRDEEGEESYYIPVEVKYGKMRNPRVFLINQKNKTSLDESTIEVLDKIEIARADIVLSPYKWEVNDKTGIKAYLKSGYFTMDTDRFAEKYSVEETFSSDLSNTDDLPF